MTERDDTLEEIASYIDDSKEAAQRMGKLPLVAALEVMSSEVRSRKGSAIASEMPYPSQGPKYDESDRANVLEVTYDGSTLVLPYEARDVLWDYFEDWDYEGIKLTMKTMTRAEIEALDEFEGF